MLTAFFGFLRVSEYTSTFVSSYDPNSTLCYEDVVFKDAHIHINIKASKTDPFCNELFFVCDKLHLRCITFKYLLEKQFKIKVIQVAPLLILSS